MLICYTYISGKIVIKNTYMILFVELHNLFHYHYMDYNEPIRSLMLA